MYGHFVPQVYQRSWHTENGMENVYYFDKNDVSKPKNKQGGNVGKNLGVEDLYIIGTDDVINGLDASNEQLEKSFDKYIEDKWNSVLQNVNNMVSYVNNQDKAIAAIKKDDIPEQLSDDLVSFIVMQYFRIKKNFEKVDNGIVKTILQLCKDDYIKKTGIDESQIPDLQNDDGFYNSVWKSILLDCFEKRDSILDLVSKNILSNYSFAVFSTKTPVPTFILADNPVIWNTCDPKSYETLESGIFMPVTPYVLIALLRFSDDCGLKIGDYGFFNVNANFSKYINHILLNQSDKTIGFCEDSVKDKISNHFNRESDWDSMFIEN